MYFQKTPKKPPLFDSDCEAVLLEQQWTQLLLKWLNICVHPQSKATQLNLNSVIEIIHKYRDDICATDIDRFVLDDDLEPFLRYKYPLFRLRFLSDEKEKSRKIYLMTSLLLFHCCVSSINGIVVRDICDKLCKEERELILKFCERLNEMEVTLNNVEVAINDAIKMMEKKKMTRKNKLSSPIIAHSTTSAAVTESEPSIESISIATNASEESKKSAMIQFSGFALTTTNTSVITSDSELTSIVCQWSPQPSVTEKSFNYRIETIYEDDSFDINTSSILNPEILKNQSSVKSSDTIKSVTEKKCSQCKMKSVTKSSSLIPDDVIYLAITDDDVVYDPSSENNLDWIDSRLADSCKPIDVCSISHSVDDSVNGSMKMSSPVNENSCEDACKLVDRGVNSEAVESASILFIASSTVNACPGANLVPYLGSTLTITSSALGSCSIVTYPNKRCKWFKRNRHPHGSGSDDASARFCCKKTICCNDNESSLTEIYTSEPSPSTESNLTSPLRNHIEFNKAVVKKSVGVKPKTASKQESVDKTNSEDKPEAAGKPKMKDKSTVKDKVKVADRQNSVDSPLNSDNNLGSDSESAQSSDTRRSEQSSEKFFKLALGTSRSNQLQLYKVKTSIKCLLDKRLSKAAEGDAATDSEREGSQKEIEKEDSEDKGDKIKKKESKESEKKETGKKISFMDEEAKDAIKKDGSVKDGKEKIKLGKEIEENEKQKDTKKEMVQEERRKKKDSERRKLSNRAVLFGKIPRYPDQPSKLTYALCTTFIFVLIATALIISIYNFPSPNALKHNIHQLRSHKNDTQPLLNPVNQKTLVEVEVDADRRNIYGPHAASYSWICKNGVCERVKMLASQGDFHLSLSRCILLCSGPQIWPKPISYTSFSNIIVGIATSGMEYKFQNVPSQPVHQLLAEAFKLFLAELARLERTDLQSTYKSTGEFEIKKLTIFINVETDSDPKLRLNTDESYYLTIETVIDRVKVSISSASFSGVRHGLETLSQLMLLDQSSGYLITLSHLQIKDAPAYKYRGIMIDTGRNFIPLLDLIRVVDAMSSCKLNTLHWRVSDAASFPLLLPGLEKLVSYGAYDSTMTYDEDAIRTLVNRAAVRGIRVVIEVAMPGPVGRAWSWADYAICPKKINNLTCAKETCIRLDMAENLFDFLEGLYSQIITLTGVEDVFHLSAGVFSLSNCYNVLSDRVGFLNKALTVLKNANKGFLPKLPIIWYTGHLKDPYEAQTWEHFGVQMTDWPEGLVFAYKNYRLIHSSKWCLSCEMKNNRCYRYRTWQEMYSWKLWQNVEAYSIEGGESILWTDLVDSANLDYHLWPRAAAVAERLWSDSVINSTATGDVYKRLDTHRWRMLIRGYKVQPVWPVWCSFNPSICLAAIRR